MWCTWRQMKVFLLTRWRRWTLTNVWTNNNRSKYANKLRRKTVNGLLYTQLIVKQKSFRLVHTCAYISRQIVKRSKVILWLFFLSCQTERRKDNNNDDVLAFAAAEICACEDIAHIIRMIYSFGHFHVWKMAKRVYNKCANDFHLLLCNITCSSDH